MIIITHKHDTPLGMDAAHFVRKQYHRRYGVHHMPAPDIWCSARQENSGILFGALGLYSGAQRRLMAERYFAPEIITEATGAAPRDRIFEIGSRATVDMHPSLISAMTMRMLGALAIAQNPQLPCYIMVTAERTIGRLIRSSGLTPTRVGVPDYTRLPATDRRRWHGYFRIPRVCYTVRIDKEEISMIQQQCSSTC